MNIVRRIGSVKSHWKLFLNDSLVGNVIGSETELCSNQKVWLKIQSSIFFKISDSCTLKINVHFNVGMY